jgi:DUF1680 family protein
VNLYVPSRLRWSARDVTLTQATDFPYGDTTTLTIRGRGTFDIHARVPRWAAHGFFVRVNGQDQRLDAQPGTYLTVRRDWKEGDTLELRMPFGFHLSPVMDQPNIASLFYGPVLLAAEESEPRATWRPITLNDPDVGGSITGDPETLRFEKDGIRFKPFFETYDRCSVYLDVTLE